MKEEQVRGMGCRCDRKVGYEGQWRSTRRRDGRWWVMEECRKKGWGVVGDGGEP